MRATFVVLCLGPLWAGCSSWDEDTPDHLDFDLPTVMWTISSDDPQWRTWPPPNTAVPNFVCTGPEALSTDCCASPFDCPRYPFACDPVTTFCALTFNVESTQSIDLAGDVRAIAAVRERVFAKVALLSLSTTASADEDCPIRAANLYVGPENLSSSSSSVSTFFAPVNLEVGPQPVLPDANARQAFSAFAREYERPFSLLLSAQMVVPNGLPARGSLLVAVNGRARAFY